MSIMDVISTVFWIVGIVAVTFSVFNFLSSKNGEQFMDSLINSLEQSDYSSSKNSHNDDENEEYRYQLQVRGGTMWLNVGGTRNEAGAMDGADKEKSSNPDKQYRVVALNKRGKIVGIISS